MSSLSRRDTARLVAAAVTAAAAAAAWYYLIRVEEKDDAGRRYGRGTATASSSSSSASASSSSSSSPSSSSSSVPSSAAAAAAAEPKLRRPRVSRQDVLDVLRERYALSSSDLAELKELPSYDDLNYFVRTARGGPAFVLKFNLSEVDGADLRLENAAMRLLGPDNRRDPTLGALVPRLVPTATSTAGGCAPADMFRFTQRQPNPPDAGPDGRKRVYHVRMLTFIPGMMLADVPIAKRTAAFLGSVGALLGRCDASFGQHERTVPLGAEHTAVAASRDHFWDLRNAMRLRAWTASVGRKADRDLLARAFDLFGAVQARIDGTLRRQVTHNDGNDHNIVVSEEEETGGAGETAGAGGPGYRVAGLIDFGDIVHTTLANNLGIALAYCCCDTTTGKAGSDGKSELGQAEYAHRTAAAIVRGYHAHMPLERDEVDVLWWLMLGRVCHSLASSAKRSEGEPDNAYLRASEAPFWRLLRAISNPSFEAHAARAKNELREACGYSKR